MENNGAMTTEDIMKLLPHRFPMLLVDRVTECDFDSRIVGIKNLTINEHFFQGHFPDNPIMPGVLQLEAMAQLGGVLLNRKIDREGMISYFTGINNAKFRRVLKPGDQVRMEVEVQKMKLSMAKVHGECYVGDELACSADMSFHMVEG